MGAEPSFEAEEPLRAADRAIVAAFRKCIQKIKDVPMIPGKKTEGISPRSAARHSRRLRHKGRQHPGCDGGGDGDADDAARIAPEGLSHGKGHGLSPVSFDLAQ